jgi:hypothetical protein
VQLGAFRGKVGCPGGCAIAEVTSAGGRDAAQSSVAIMDK